MEFFLILLLAYSTACLFLGLMAFIFAPKTVHELYSKGNLSFTDVIFWHWRWKSRIQELLNKEIITRKEALDLENYDLYGKHGESAKHKIPSNSLKVLYINKDISIEDYRKIKEARSIAEPASFSNHSALALFKERIVSFETMCQKNMLAIANLFEIAPIKKYIINNQDVYHTLLDFSSTCIVNITKLLNDHPKLQTLLCERHINLVQLKSMGKLEIEILNLGNIANLLKDKQITFGKVKAISQDKELVQELRNLEKVKLMSLFNNQAAGCKETHTRPRRNSI